MLCGSRSGVIPFGGYPFGGGAHYPDEGSQALANLSVVFGANGGKTVENSVYPIWAFVKGLCALITCSSNSLARSPDRGAGEPVSA